MILSTVFFFLCNFISKISSFNSIEILYYQNIIGTFTSYFLIYYNNIPLVATYTTTLASATVHKTVLPLLCKVKASSVLFREGEVVLVVYSRLSEVDGSNYIAPNDRTVVSVYATKNRIIIGE